MKNHEIGFVPTVKEALLWQEELQLATLAFVNCAILPTIACEICEEEEPWAGVRCFFRKSGFSLGV